MAALIFLLPVCICADVRVPPAKIIHKNCLHCYVYGLDMLQTAHLVRRREDIEKQIYILRPDGRRRRRFLRAR